jgi:hypothetical protein
MRYASYKPLHTGLQATKFDLHFRDYVLSQVVVPLYVDYWSTFMFRPQVYTYCMCRSVSCKYEALYAMYYIYIYICIYVYMYMCICMYLYIHVIMRHEGVDA